MDSGLLTFTTLGLGSTLGLIFIAGIGISSSTGTPYDLSSSTYAVLDGVWRFLVSPKASLARVDLKRVWGVLDTLARDYLVHSLVALARLACVGIEECQRVEEDFRVRYGEYSWRNFSKLLRIVKIWEPLPYDSVIGQPQNTNGRVFNDTRDEGLVWVYLRFRMGNLRMRINRNSSDPWMVYGHYLSVPAYLPLEKDGSLRVDLIREKFRIEEVELLVPGRYETHRVFAGDRISAFMLHSLVEGENCVNVVEVEDIYCQLRRHFRQWLRCTRIHYYARLTCYFVTVLAILCACSIPAMCLSNLFPGKLWWCFCHFIGIAMAIIAYEQFIEHRQRKHGSDIPWHGMPPEHSAYWLRPRVQGRYL